MARAKPPIPASYALEHAAWANNRVIIGIDEAGRGCFSGPVVAAAVILPPGYSLILHDSKRLSDEAIEKIYHHIMRTCTAAVGIVPAHLIDAWGIVAATTYAMTRAASSVEMNTYLEIEALAVDAVTLTHPTRPVHSAPYGEQWSASIAAASIVAKYTRDYYLRLLDPVFPSFSLEQHHGYGTAQHLKALELFGRSVIHRRSFCTIPSTDVQSSIF